MVLTAGRPQWAPAAVEPISKLLNKDMVVFEWGAGFSTPWIADRVKHLFVMDDDENWVNMAKARSGQNVDFFVYPSSHYKYRDTIFYISELFGIDIAFVDGMERFECFFKSAQHVKKGGLIVLDDSERTEYKKCFEIGLQVIAEYGTQQKTTVFRK